jgi:transcriptional regulator with XRE-family HTH domain
VADELTPEQMTGQVLRSFREGAGESQEQLARAMVRRGHRGWRQSTVAKTEAAQRPLRVNELVDLAAIFDVSLDVLVKGNPYRGLTSVAAAREELAQVTARLESLEAQLAKVMRAAVDLDGEIVGLESSKAELHRLALLLQEFIDSKEGS